MGRGLRKPAAETRKGGALLLYYSETSQDGKFGKSRQTSLQEVQRPLMTPDECRRLPG
ncbi:MAG: type IV secretory system conjugative DNA transfer family protein [Synergistaceae bacterium]|nr:type IV secretory system conjugative DNA transfer family protein [Synergistaceae bacterium]